MYWNNSLAAHRLCLVTLMSWNTSRVGPVDTLKETVRCDGYRCLGRSSFCSEPQSLLQSYRQKLLRAQGQVDETHQLWLSLFHENWYSCIDPIHLGCGIRSASDSFQLYFGEFLCCVGQIRSLKTVFPPLENGFCWC